MPTTEPAVEAMLKLADVKKTDVVYDLGCGDGRIVTTAAKAFGARGVGIDINPVRIDEAKENAKKAGMENLVRFEEEKEVTVPDSGEDSFLSHRLYLWIVPSAEGK